MTGFFQRLRSRIFWADTATKACLTATLATPFEYFALGLPAERVFALRGAAIAVDVLTAGAYGAFQDMVRAGLGRTRLGRWGSDTLAFATFQVPLYALYLTLAVTDGWQIRTGSLLMLALSPIAGPGLGAALDVVRRGLLRLRAVPAPDAKADDDQRAA